MTTEQIKKIAIAINDARLEGRATREVHAAEIARLDAILTSTGRTWADLQN